MKGRRVEAKEARMSAPKNVIIELSATAVPSAGAMGIGPAAAIAIEAVVPKDIPGINLDPDFAAVPLPKHLPKVTSVSPFDVGVAFVLDASPQVSTYVVRGSIDSKAITESGFSFKPPAGVMGIYADPTIEVCIICPGSPALGTDTDIAGLLGVPDLAQNCMDGSGVTVAIVDTGINLAYLRAHGKNPHLDAQASWVPRQGLTPGDLPVNHGTMCAYDALIAAPNCRLLDIAVLLSNQSGGSIMDGLLSDAVRAYSHLLRLMLAPKRPGDAPSMIVSNSWGMFNPSWDFPIGHPGNYSDNSAHPFNRIVGSLELAGADILFAAGNCGRDCPDGRCQGVTNAGIYGANSHPQVLSIAGVDVTKMRVGYSTSGPGRLTRMKPDLSSYTHFKGSGVYPADGGTSAATPVAAGVVAAFRSRFPYVASDPNTHPAAVRSLLTRTAEDRGAIGFDFDYGWGIINGKRLATLSALTALEPVRVSRAPVLAVVPEPAVEAGLQEVATVVPPEIAKVKAATA